jgi:hypothetical protein
MSDVITAVSVKITEFWDAGQHSLVAETDRRSTVLTASAIRATH